MGDIRLAARTETDRAAWINAIKDVISRKDDGEAGGEVQCSPSSTIIIIKKRKIYISDIMTIGIRMRVLQITTPINQLDKEFRMVNQPIKELRMEQCVLGRNAYNFYEEVLGQCPSLQKISLCKSNIGNLGSEFLGKLIKAERLPNLVFLDLTQNNISSLGCKLLAKAISSDKTISELILTFNPLGDIGTKALANALADNTVLRILRLMQCGITDVGCRSFLPVLDPKHPGSLGKHKKKI